jgi:hypothetical protein
VGMLLSYGIFAYASVLSPRGQSDGVNIVGKVTMQVYNPDGTLARVWHGHNSLSAESINGIAGCLSGATTTPAYFGTCSSWISYISISCSCTSFPIEAAANTPFANTPGVACSASSASPGCTGWVSTATFSSSDFSTAGCGSSCTVNNADAQNSGYAFDHITVGSPLTVSAGDSLQVTITFTVS